MRRATFACLLLWLLPLNAAAGPDEPQDVPEIRKPLVRVGNASFDLRAEYRLRNIYINPLELNGLDATEVSYGIQRFRTGLDFDIDDLVRIRAQIDFLDGVLVGDNGLVWGEDPYPNEGVSSAARWPNEAGIAVVRKEGEDPYDPDSYTYGLKKLDPIKIRRVWGEVSLGVGMLRAGRMPAFEGRGILGNDGDNDENRFGPAGRGNSVDRILFGTKPIEVARVLIEGDPKAADPRQDRGLFLAFAYDRMVDDAIQIPIDDADQFGASVYYLLPDFEILGISCRDLKLAASLGYRWSYQMQTSVYAAPLELKVTIEDFQLEAQAAILVGRTREVSDALSLMGGMTPQVQDIRAFGMFAIADYHLGPITLTLEFDYASGDADPRPDSTLTDFYFAEDTKVGLLLFPQVLAYETARSAAAATEILKGLGSNALPSTRVATGGAFFNGIALFPQATWHITDDVFVRAGVLMAWTAAPLTDPHVSLMNEDGDYINDDVVNFNGGPPGDYYGTEFDLRFSARLWGYFYFDLEGAVLLPGDALADEHGEAVPSTMAEARLTFRY